jgi:hypothetical protein
MKLLTKTLVLAITLASANGAFAQSPTSPSSASPTSVTRQRKATTDATPQTAAGSEARKRSRAQQ